MLELLKANPWLLVVCMALLIPILGIIFGTITSCLAHPCQVTGDRAENDAQDRDQQGHADNQEPGVGFQQFEHGWLFLYNGPLARILPANELFVGATRRFEQP